MKIFKFFGKRTIKTAIALGICMLLYVILKLLDTKIIVGGVSLYKREKGFRFSDFYSPFFAGIAAAYSLYPSKKESISQAKNRVIASLLGGLIGIFLTISYGVIGKISGNDFFEWPNLGDSYKVSQYILPYILVTVFVTIVIAVGNLIDKKSAIFVGILTLISVTINPMGMIVNRYDKSLEFLGEAVFGFNRILSTVVGVFITLCVNLIRLPRNKNKDILFVVGIEGAIKENKEELKEFAKYKIKEFSEQNVNISLFTARPPMRFVELLPNVVINNPIICCSGAAIYDLKENKYLYTCPLSLDETNQITSVLDGMEVVPFKNIVYDDTLLITTKDKNYKYNRYYYDLRLDSPYSNIIDKDCFNNDVLFFIILETMDIIVNIIDKLGKDNYFYDIMDCPDYENIYYLKIYNKDIKKMNGLKEYINNHNYRLCALTDHEESNYLLDAADIKVTYKSNTYDNADIYLEKESYDTLFKNVNKIFHSKQYKK